MKNLSRLLVCATVVVGCLSACNAILGIGDLVDPGEADGSAETGPTSDSSGLDGSVTDSSVADSSLPDSFVPDGALCGSPGEADPCFVVVAQSDGGSVFPTWPITSDLIVQDTNQAMTQPTKPMYTDGGAGTVIETYSQLTWQTTHSAGDVAVDFATASSSCQALGAGWRVPTRVELATAQYRSAAFTASSGPTSCVPTPFEVNQATRLWTSTQVPGVSFADSNYAGTEMPGCGFYTEPRTSVANVRCVKGEPKSATFLVSKKSDTVLAVETHLEWERIGAIVQGYAGAKAHCDSLGWRVPVIQEVYAIIDTRKLTLLPDAFLLPPGPAPRAIVSQTVGFYVGSAPYYSAVSVLPAAPGAEDSCSGDDGVMNLLVRCVRGAQ